MKPTFAFDHPDTALLALAERLAKVEKTETVDDSAGRILSDGIRADRDSPAADVSAMDGFAVRLSDLKTNVTVPISGESKAGQQPPTMVPGQVVRIFTGAIVPSQCEAVVKREDTEELESDVRFLETAILSTRHGVHIRRRGENASAGSEVLQPGTEVSPAVATALANFGSVQPNVFRRVKVAVLTTGDEVVDPSSKVLEPWQLRNSNQAAIVALLGTRNFIEIERVIHVPDDPKSLLSTLRQATLQCDAIVMTGGVSKGDYDYVPETIESVGGNVVFHGLPIRPGKPILGAATDDGKLILGLPGNPVSATINCHRFGLPLLSHMACKSDWNWLPSLVSLQEPIPQPIPLHQMLLVRDVEVGLVANIPSKGSGDLVALAASDGYVSINPNDTSTGPWPMYRW